MAWYQKDIQEIFSRLGTSDYGLDDAQAAELLQRHGPNLIIEPEKISKIKLFFHQFASPLIYILILAAMITAYLQEYKDSLVIVVVVLFNALIGFFQEYKAEKSVMALKQMAAPKARVLRQGREREIPSELLVPGDVVILESGVKVPADVRLFRTVELRVDEAILTGESLPVEKTSTTLQEENLTPGDQKNMAFLGTVVLMGRGRGVVVETGGGTILGSIAEEVKRISPTQTPLQTKFARFANILGLIVLAASAVLFLLGVLTGEAPRDMFMTIVAAAVAAIPEGLPVVVTITLARSVALMAKRNAIIRKLPAVETLGSTTVICSDKTGTLTKNEMTVKLIYDGEKAYEVTGSGYNPVGEILQAWLPVEKTAWGDLERVLRHRPPMQ